MDPKFTTPSSPEWWGGIECTIDRVGNRFYDQLAATGHYDRPEDIARFARLGLRKMRYPILWEHHAPDRHRAIAWDDTARNLHALREHDVEPVAGLVHHGSGPAYTSLIDPDFAGCLAEYAGKVSNRFPFLNYFTPVNEPLTTARFSGLYGHWYPHHRNDRSFVRMLLHQLKATVLSMQAIRSVNPRAKLVQTEDLGKTHSTPALRYQADFENDRRWLTFDILCGRFVPGHRFWNWFVKELGIDEKALWFFVDHPCPPDLLGLNYYVTSERWLDENLADFPVFTHGGNNRHSYADTEVVRARPGLRLGVQQLGREVWDRYGIPLAFTEVHLHCTREEQMRWLAEIWAEANALCREGIPVAGVTAWALLGAFDWDSLLTRTAGHYEPGVFDVSNGPVRKTALAPLLSALARNGRSGHPLLHSKGWWHGPQAANAAGTSPALLLIGADEPLALTLKTACGQRGIGYCHELEEVPAELPENSGARLAISPWAVLRFDASAGLQFRSDRLHVTAPSGADLLQVVHHVLDLVIDRATGAWNLKDTGKPDATPEFSVNVPAAAVGG